MTAVTGDAEGKVPIRPPTIRGAFPQPEKRGPVSVLVSVCLHVLLIWLLVMVTAVVANPDAVNEVFAFLDPAKLPGGGGGGGSGGAVKLKTPPPPPPEEKPKPVVPPPPPVVPVEVPKEIPPVVAEPTPVAAATTAPTGVSSGSGGGTGGGIGTGEGTGTGSGKGPGSGSGTGGGDGAGGKKSVDPQSEQLILPPLDGTPKDLRGKEISVSFFVEITGLVSKVTTDPVIKDNKFRKLFDDVMKGYRWKAGKDSTGKKVAMWANMKITFQ